MKNTDLGLHVSPCLQHVRTPPLRKRNLFFRNNFIHTCVVQHVTMYQHFNYPDTGLYAYLEPQHVYRPLQEQKFVRSFRNNIVYACANQFINFWNSDTGLYVYLETSSATVGLSPTEICVCMELTSTRGDASTISTVGIPWCRIKRIASTLYSTGTS